MNRNINRSSFSAALSLIGLLLALSAPAYAQVVMWGGRVIDSNSGSPQEWILGAPDGQCVGFNRSTYSEVGDFRGGPTPGLAALLGVSPTTLANADVIAFELNGGHAAFAPGPPPFVIHWETSNWVFSDGGTSLTTAWDGTVGSPGSPYVMAVGSLDAEDYRRFFGFASFSVLTRVVSYIIFDLPPTIDTLSPRFTVRVSDGGALPGEGTPDPDAIGVFARPCDAAFRVTYAAIEATPVAYSGACPATINFNGKIETNGAGLVQYRFIRSDGGTGPIVDLYFDRAEVKYVNTTWTLGDACLLPYYEGWVAIQIISPNPLESNHAAFKVSCAEIKK
jgi:hypothetical protein